MLRLKPRWLPSAQRKSRIPISIRHTSTKLNPERSRQTSFERTLTKYSSLLKSWFVYGSVAVLTWHICSDFIGYFAPTYGVSMVPTLSSFGDWVWIDKHYRRGRDVKIGDLVSFKHPIKEDEFAIKRLVGMGGDFVLMNTPDKSDVMIQVPQGHCWLVGDNLKHSRDSRHFGPLPMALIIGKVTAKIDYRYKFAWIENGLQPGNEDDYELD